MRCIGLDLSVRTSHTAVVLDDGVRQGGAFKVSHDLEGFENLLARGTSGDGVCAFVMEPTGNVWQVLCSWLTQNGQDVYVVPGRKVSDLRKFLNRHTKTDVIDAEAAARIPDADREGLIQWNHTACMRISLKRMVKERAYFVEQGSRIKRRLKCLVDLVDPGLVKAFGENLYGRAGRAFLSRYLDPFKVIKMGRAHLEDFLRSRGRSRDVSALTHRVWAACKARSALLEKVKESHLLPFDYPEIGKEAAREICVLEKLESVVKDLEASISELYSQVDPAKTLMEIPGIGEAIAPTLEALAGDVERFRSASAYVSFMGLCPRQNDTGVSKKAGQRMTKAGNSLLKQYMYLAADKARQNDPELAAKYHRLTKRGKHHSAAVIAVANSLARRVYNVLTRRDRNGSASHIYRTPGGRELSKVEAKAWVKETYPSKRESQSRQASADASNAKLDAEAQNEKRDASDIKSGQSEDSTTSSQRPTKESNAAPESRNPITPCNLDKSEPTGSSGSPHAPQIVGIQHISTAIQALLETGESIVDNPRKTSGKQADADPRKTRS